MATDTAGGSQKNRRSTSPSRPPASSSARPARPVGARRGDGDRHPPRGSGQPAGRVHDPGRSRRGGGRGRGRSRSRWRPSSTPATRPHWRAIGWRYRWSIQTIRAASCSGCCAGNSALRTERCGNGRVPRGARELRRQECDGERHQRANADQRAGPSSSSSAARPATGQSSISTTFRIRSIRMGCRVPFFRATSPRWRQAPHGILQASLRRPGLQPR